MEVLFAIFSSLLCALIAAFFASHRGRDPVSWYFIGLLAGTLGVLTLFLLKPLEAARQPK